MIANVLQFLMPNGRKRLMTVKLSDAVSEGYRNLIAQGCRLTAEVLRNGTVSLCIEEPKLGDFDCQLCANGPEVPKTLETMIANFDVDEFLKWKEHA